jgi:hypothetical protein
VEALVSGLDLTDDDFLDPEKNQGGGAMFRTTVSAVLAALALGMAAELKPYPRVRTEPWFDKYAREAMASLRKFSPGAEVEIWMTDDSLETVLAFYKPSGTERPAFAQPLIANLKARSGRDVKATYVIFDGATSPVESKHYVSIQRPVIVQFEPLDVHDVTQIMVYRVNK